MKSLIFIFNLVLAGLVIGFGYRICQKHMTPDTDQARPGRLTALPPSPAGQTDSRPPKKRHYAPVVKRNLFRVRTENSPNTDKPPVLRAKSAESTAPEAGLRYRLFGTVTGSPEQYAVIEDKKNKKQILAGQGDTLDRFVVKAILRNKVVLSADGRAQTLEMTANPARRNTVPGPQTHRAGKTVPVQPPANRSLTVLLDRDSLLQAVSESSGRKIRVKTRPHYTEGKLDGLIIYRLRPDSVLKQAGFHNGDILKTVNGMPVSAGDTAEDLIRRILTTDTARLALLRRGRPVTLNYAPAQ